jgi:hypothetical protein
MYNKLLIINLNSRQQCTHAINIFIYLNEGGKVSIESSLVRRVLVLLRATCFAWQCAGTILALGTGTGTGVDEERFKEISLSFQKIFEKIRISNTYDEVYDFHEYIATELEVLTVRAEEILHPFLTSYHINPLSPLPSFLPQRRGGSTTNSGLYMHIYMCIYM